MCQILTQADSSQQTQASLRREAGGEQRLQDVVGKGQRNHGLVGRVDHQHGDPQTQEPGTKRKEGGTVTNTEAWEKQWGVQQHTQAGAQWEETYHKGTWYILCTSFHLQLSKQVILGRNVNSVLGLS